MHVGEYDKAEPIFIDALLQAKRIKSNLHIGLALYNLALFYRLKGDLEASIKACDEALISFKDDYQYIIYVLINKALCLIKMKDFTQGKEVIMQGLELAKNNKAMTLLIEIISHTATLDNKESCDYLENFAIPYSRTSDVDDGGGIYLALELCHTLEAHYKKKRLLKKAQAVATIARDILLEMHHKGVVFE